MVNQDGVKDPSLQEQTNMAKQEALPNPPDPGSQRFSETLAAQIATELKIKNSFPNDFRLIIAVDRNGKRWVMIAHDAEPELVSGMVDKTEVYGDRKIPGYAQRNSMFEYIYSDGERGWGWINGGGGGAWWP